MADVWKKKKQRKKKRPVQRPQYMRQSASYLQFLPYKKYIYMYIFIYHSDGLFFFC